MNSRNKYVSPISMYQQRRRILPHVIPDGSQWKFRPVMAFCRVTVPVRNGTGTSVRTSQAVQTNNIEASGIECLTRPSEKRAPPVRDVGTTAQRMADD